MQDFLKNSIFNFCLHNETIRYSSERKINFGEYIIFLDSQTPIYKSTWSNKELILFGYVVDVKTGEDEEITENILKKTSSIQEVLEYEKYLGGKYLIFYRENRSYYVIPDATASISFCYAVVDGKTVCSSISEYIAKYLNLKADPILQKIRNNSEISQAMPFDLTVYKEIKHLLPNHYYSFHEKRALRFINAINSQEKISPQKAAEVTAPYIENITRYFSSFFKLYCPITSGRDSRVVLAFLRKVVKNKSLECYTIKHDEQTGLEPDLVIPKRIAEKVGFYYYQIRDILPSNELIKQIDTILGTGKYSKRTLKIANTVYNYFNGGAIINGDIIGQVGKCSLHRDIPNSLATVGYFRCKLHNYSKESKKFLKEWIDDIKKSDENINTFDLFSIENRMGRWASQENILYNTIGQRYLNIFNSRSIIYEWTRVDRGLRKKSAIHLALIKNIDEKLLEIPFEKDMNVFTLLPKANGIFYFIFGYIKYYVQKVIFLIHKYEE